MNMDAAKLYSWFLGPKAENADTLERQRWTDFGRVKPLSL